MTYLILPVSLAGNRSGTIYAIRILIHEPAYTLSPVHHPQNGVG